MLTGFCFAVAKVLVPFQHINTLQLSGPVHSALLHSKRGAGGVLVLWIYQSKFGFIHEPWIKFPAWVSIMTPWHHSTCWLLVYMLMIWMFLFFNATKNRRFNILMWQKQIWFTVSSMPAFSCMCSLLLMLSGLQVCFSYDSCFSVRIHLM